MTVIIVLAHNLTPTTKPYPLSDQVSSTKPSLEFSARATLDVPESVGPHFNGVVNSDTYLQFYGPLAETSTTANAARRIAQYLLERIPNTNLWNYFQTHNLDPKLQEYLSLNNKAPVGFFCGSPDLVPNLFFDHDYKIGGFSCVTPEIPERWVNVCNQLDQVVVPSKFCKQAFIDSGVTTSISVIAYGLEPAYRPSDKIIPDVWFFNVFEDDNYFRKLTKELIRSFMRTFADKPNVKLRLHVKKPAKVKKIIERFNAHDQVFLSQQTDITTRELARLYQSAHACVHTTQGEGFCMVPLESIACGTPVIAPFHTCLVDCLTPDNAIEVSVACIRPSYQRYGHMTEAGYIVDEEDLRRCLRFVYDNWQSEKQRVMKAQETVRQRYQWPTVLDGLMDLIPSEQTLSALESNT